MPVSTDAVIELYEDLVALKDDASALDKIVRALEAFCAFIDGGIISVGVMELLSFLAKRALSNATDAVFWAVAIRVDYFRRNARKNMGWKEVQLAWKATALSRKCSLCGNVGHNKSGCDPKLRDYLFKKGIVDKISDAGDWLDMAGE